MNQIKAYKNILLPLSFVAMAVFSLASPAWSGFQMSQVSWRICGVYTALSAWGVPLWICGVGVAYLTGDNVYDTGFVMKKRLPRAAVGCLVWWMVSTLVMMKYTRPNELDFDTFFECMGSVLNSPFNLRLLQLCVIFFAFYPLLRKIAKNERLTGYAVAVFFVFAALVPAIEYIPYVNHLNLFLKQVNWGFFTSNGLYLFLGLFLLRKSFVWHERTVIYCLGVFGTVAMYCCTVFVSPQDGGYDGVFVGEASPFTAMQVSALVVLVRQHAGKKGRLLHSGAASVAAGAAYAVIPAFTVMRYLLEKHIAFGAMGLAAAIPLEAALLTVCAIAFAAIVRRIPVISYFTA